MNQEFSWDAQVKPRHIHIVFFVLICLILGISVVYFFSKGDYFASFLFGLFIIAITYSQVSKKTYTSKCSFTEDSVKIDKQELKYKELESFLPLDNETIILYKKDKDYVLLPIRPDYFEQIEIMLSSVAEKRMSP